MGRNAMPADTDPEVFSLVVARWRSMTIAERGALADQLSVDVALLATSAIRAERPHATDVEVQHELARRRYGRQLADEAYACLLG